jgi:DNA-binding XRE family transcriptional regulator
MANTNRAFFMPKTWVFLKLCQVQLDNIISRNMCNFKNNSTLFLMSKDVNLTFSENLARLRKMKGLSQGDLAKLSGISSAHDQPL